MNQKQQIHLGKTALGIELGSTRMKAVLIGAEHTILASGSYAWENRLEGGCWTYRLEDVWQGIREAYRELAQEVAKRYGETLTAVGAMGVSAMMHGYLAFDKNGGLLTPFRTWRNTTTAEASEELTRELGVSMPQRWSAAHYYQAVLNEEPHVKDVAFLTTLAGYVHFKLTGKKVLGIGDASGMFPVGGRTYDQHLMKKMNALLAKKGRFADFSGLLPEVLCAGEAAGVLTEEGARLLDPSGNLTAGVPLCPPEGDAGTGMVATNSVRERTGNVSAGTSVFAMAVLERPLQRAYPEIDVVTTPTGRAVAMVHCNNCSSDIDAWANVFREFSGALGVPCSMSDALNALFSKALEGDADCSGLVNYNYLSGEPITGLGEGRPLFARRPDSRFTFANFARTQLYSAMATLELGMDILLEREGVRLDSLYGHGGFFKAAGAGQKLMAGALGVPVTVMETAGEGGAWGMALLAAYAAEKSPDETLEAYLENKVFSGCNRSTETPDEASAAGFASYLERYRRALGVETCAVKLI